MLPAAVSQVHDIKGVGGWVGVGKVAAKKLKINAALVSLGIIYPQDKSFPTEQTLVAHTHRSAFWTADTTAYLSAHAPDLDRH